MRETYTFRVLETAAMETLGPSIGESRGLARVIETTGEDPLFRRVGAIDLEWRQQGRGFLLGWDVHRSYNDEELATADYLHLIIVPVFEPAGVECGTEYADGTACVKCGYGRQQVSALRIDGKRIPPAKDLAETIAGEEWLVSQRLGDMLNAGEFTGMELRSVEHCRRPGETLPDWNQLMIQRNGVVVTGQTKAGISPFDHDEAGQYRCPLGHVMGLNLLSELVVEAGEPPGRDFALTLQAVGVKRGLLVPRRQMLISQRVWQLLKTSKARGWRVEVAHVIQ